MYAHFYQLAENPFNLTPDPKFHYVNESTREALASILHGLKARKGFLTLIGEAGTGKTTLLKKILDEIEGETQVVFVFNPGVSFDELLEFICSELGLATDGRRLQMLDRLNEYLLEQLTSGRNVVVMIDEAQTLTDSVLEELRLLSNLETSKEKILQILLAGQPELEEKLRRPNLRQLRQRIAVRATLRPMRLTEIGAYVQTRLRSAGASRDDLFTKGALHKIWRASKGIPRVVNVICDNAMMIAFAEGKKRIGYGVAVEAVRDLEGSAHRLADVKQLLRHWLGGTWVRYAAAAAVALIVFVPINRWLQARRDARLAAATSVEAVRQVREAARQVRPAAQPAGGDEGQDAAAVSAAAGDAAALAADPSTKRPVAPVPGDADSLASDPAPPAGAVKEPESARQTAEVAAGTTDSSADLAIAPPKQAPALEPVTEDEAVAASIRRAQVIARATAARLFDERRRRELGSPEELEVALPGPSTPPPATTAPKPRASSSESQSAAGESVARATFPAAPAVAATPRVAGAEARGSGQGGAEAPRVRGLENVPEEVAPKAVPAPARRPEPARTVRSAADVRPATLPAHAKPPTPELAALGATHEDRTATAGGKPQGVAPAAVVERREPLIGRIVEVDRGDTIWDIAIEQYGTAGPKTLRRILTANPTIEDPRHLEVGSRVVLPFVRADRMVQRGEGGQGFRVILAAAPDAMSLAPTQSWAHSVLPTLDLRVVQGPSRSGELLLVAEGIPSRQAAKSMADVLLEAHQKAVAADAAASKRSSELSSLIP
ncbi:MAG: LysM peptidoglycan-binding domain-containing protein [Deltaproteobacteria bacterium]|nr:MAG: LysM peptidoglycan-binding domain-containing protein [Deltaproteobacteria bacterium]